MVLLKRYALSLLSLARAITSKTRCSAVLRVVIRRRDSHGSSRISFLADNKRTPGALDPVGSGIRPSFRLYLTPLLSCGPLVYGANCVTVRLKAWSLR